MYYVYKITNKINGKFYIGKRKHITPYKDSYMGSGKQIQFAIKKYGRLNFTKEILQIFESNDGAAKYEAELVTKEVVANGNSYNMHEGGHGGFAHINSLPVSDRPNVIAFKEKYARGEIKVGGTQYWTADSRERAIRQGQINRDNGLCKGWFHTDEQKVQMSIRTSGEKNPSFGTRTYVNLNDPSETKKYKENTQPDGWIWTIDYQESKMKHSKRWYNNGSKNFLILSSDPKIIKLNLIKGRIRTESVTLVSQ